MSANSALALLMVFTISNFNAGSMGYEDAVSVSDGATIVRGNVISLFQNIREDVDGELDVTGIIESGSAKVELAPFYGLPFATNANVTVTSTETGRNATRGMATYCRSPGTATIVPPPPGYDGPPVEILTTTHLTRVKKGRIKKKPANVKLTDVEKYVTIGHIIVYNNNNKNAAFAGIPDIKRYVRLQLDQLRHLGARETLIDGDWNDESVNFPELESLHDDSRFHQHNTKAKQTFIDKAFSNSKRFRIMRVYQTVENKQNEKGERGELGHKPVLYTFGPREEGQNERYCIKWKSLKQRVKNMDSDAKLNSEKVKTESDVNKSGEFLENMIKKLEKAAMSKIRRSKSRKFLTREKHAIEMIEKHEEEMNRNPKVMRSVYTFCEEITKGSDSSKTVEKPPLTVLAKTLTDKWAALNTPDYEISLAATETIYKKPEEDKITAIFPSKRIVKKLLRTNSNSGAKDLCGLSLKLTKVVLLRSKTCFNFYYELAKAMSRIGYIPESWRQDRISFLYKRKGCRMDSTRYRPITIAPSLGKHFEAIMLCQLRRVYDLNDENHAYFHHRSCLTALLDLQEYLKKIRELGKELASEGKIVIPMILCEDIQSAFESVCFRIIEKFTELSFDAGSMNISKLFQCYLKRKARASDRFSNEQVPLHRTFDDRSTPQGSLLSPALWRIFDKVFSHIYLDGLNELQKMMPCIYDFKHLSYSDDHLTCICLVFDQFEPIEEIQKMTETVALTCRDLLDDATRTCGAGINRDKSEIIIADKWKNDKIESKKQFKWLGYHLRLDQKGILNFVEEKMIEKLKAAKKVFANITQYFRSPMVKRRIWEIYMAPIIEWYLPVIAFKKRLEDSPPNALESFQHQTLTSALGASGKVSRIFINEIAAIKPVTMKLRSLGYRLSEFITRRLSDIQAQPGEIFVPITTTVSTRAGTTETVEEPSPYPHAENKDFIDQIVILADEHNQTDPLVSELYDKKSVERLTFDKDIAVQRIKEENAKVKSFKIQYDDKKKLK